MAEHPIQGLMQTAMENIKEMVDVNTIVGDPVSTPDGGVIMPISRVGFGFVAGGSDIRFGAGSGSSTTIEGDNAVVSLPFGGGSGGGVSITPIAFLVVHKDHGVKIVSLDNNTHLWERMIDTAPKVFEKIQTMIGGSASSSASGMTGMLGGASGMGGAGTDGGMSGSGMSGASSSSGAGMGGSGSSAGGAFGMSGAKTGGSLTNAVNTEDQSGTSAAEHAVTASDIGDLAQALYPENGSADGDSTEASAT